jgi:hypothetical protein
MMVDRDETSNTRYAGYGQPAGGSERTTPSPAAIDPTSMIAAARADTVDKVVDHFLHRFMSG